MENKSRPTILEMEDLHEEMLAVVNNAIERRKLPCYLIETVLSKVHNGISQRAKNEITYLRAEEEKVNADNETNKA